MSHIFRLRSGLMACLLALPIVSAANFTLAEDASDEMKQDYKDVEGSWETMQRDSAGNMFRSVKTEQSGKSTVTTFDAAGQVVHQHTSEFELKRHGSARVFQYRNRTVTQGPRQGDIQKAPREYLYKVAGDEFVEIHGMLVGQEREPVRVTVWKRVKDAGL